MVGCCRLDRPSSFSPQHHQHSVRTQLKLARNLINLRKVFLHGRSKLVSFFFPRSLPRSASCAFVRAPPNLITFMSSNLFLSKTSSASAVWHVFADSDHRTPGHQPEPKIDFHFSARVVSIQTNGRSSLADFSICLRFNAQRYRCLSYANGANVSFLLRRSLVRCSLS